MTQRDRRASAQVYDAPRPEGRLHPGSPAANPAGIPLPWEQLLHSVSPAERERLLALAQEQGLLFSHQFPCLNSTSVDGPNPIYQVLGGRHSGWIPLRSRSVEVTDAELDPIQREAVAKALQTPDLCLIQGLPGTGKRRVATEIIRRAVARGEAVLLLAPRGCDLDTLLEKLSSEERVLAVRCLDRDEDPAHLAPAVRGFMFRAQATALREQALHQARHEAMAAEERAERCRREEALWPKLQLVAEARANLAEREQSLNGRRASLPETAAREAAEAETSKGNATNFQSRVVGALAPLRAALAKLDDTLTQLRGQIAILEQDQQDRTARLAPLRSLAEAKRNGRWWTPLWWRAAFSRDQLKAFAELEAEEPLARTALDKRTAEMREHVQEEERLREALQAEMTRQVTAEVDRRRTDLDGEESELLGERELLDDRWRELLGEMDADTVLLETANVETVRQGYGMWQERVRRQEQQADFARAWAAGLEQEAGKMEERLRVCANLVACAVRALPADEHFGDASHPVRRFDLLILMDAQDVTEDELARVAGRANRLVLIGEVGTTREIPAAIVPKVIPGSRNGATASRPGLLQRLWNALHCDPRRLPYSWLREGERLCCRLRPITAGQRRWLERERVADFQDIELRILAQPRKSPVLAEVLFPPGYSIQHAKEYIVRELEEWPISAGGASIRWDEQPDRIVLRLAEGPLSNSVEVALGAGMRERLGDPPSGQPSAEGSAGWHTGCLEFDRAAGWHRERIEEWIKRRLGLVDLGRTVQLVQRYRTDLVPAEDGRA